MKKNIYKVTLLNAFVALFSFAPIMAQKYGAVVQDKVDFKYPLNVNMNLSGNYGELRSNHFHGGVDFRIGGVVGAPIYATESGYVSQISVSPSGYGNALYITHANGYVSVYGHMLCFNDSLQAYVRGKQYENEEFKQLITLAPNVFPIAKGEMIGKAGNTGSSGGPHLHFEIRDTANVPLNIFARGILNIPDRTPPIINSVVFYGYNKDTGVVRNYYIGKKQGTQPYSSKYQKDGVIKLPSKSYIAIDAIDKQEGTAARLAVNEYKVYLDTALIYALKIGEVPFEYGRYINSLMEYNQRSLGRYMIKSYVEPGNMLKDRIICKDEGLIVLKDDLQHKIKVEVLDYLKNKTVKSYTVKREESIFANSSTDTLKCNFMAWYLPGIYTTQGLDVHIPQASLYNSIYFKVDTMETRITKFSPVWKIHKPDVPLHFPMEVSVKCTVPDSLTSKALLAQVVSGGRLYSAGGWYDSTGVIKAKLSSFGNYTVTVDIASPRISASIANNAIVKGKNISFVISDALSGIKNYRIEIDGHWVLAELDGKTSRLTVPLEYAKIKKGIKHNLVITVTDNKDNMAVVKRNFVW